MIVETSNNKFYQVTEPTDEHLTHCWWGVEVKRTRGTWMQTARAARMTEAELIRKAGCRVVEG